ncbi:acetate--CoA ligase family protein [Streptosporangium sp. NPDC048865]|uniref:acetate--CoA ligase family protein n=1 Tax=Streptosporangium sp. NPDC048865 TaxID=3155766 RepID=UPI003433D1B8
MADTAAVREHIVRVAKLVDDLPRIAELDLNPIQRRRGGPAHPAGPGLAPPLSPAPIANREHARGRRRAPGGHGGDGEAGAVRRPRCGWEGWSVLVRGGVHHVSGAEEQAAVTALSVQPWAGGGRELYVKITPSEITGRRIWRGP